MSIFNIVFFLFTYIAILQECVGQSDACILSEICPFAFHSESAYWIVPLNIRAIVYTTEKYSFRRKTGLGRCFHLFSVRVLRI